MSNIASRIRMVVHNIRIVPAGANATYYVLEYTTDMSNLWGVIDRSAKKEDLELQLAQIIMGTHPKIVLK